MTEDCVICTTIADPGTDVVHADELWHAAVQPGIEVPGWLFLSLRRHAEGATAMNEAERRTFGDVVARLTAALEQAVDAERVYLYAFGEQAPHWHVVLASRTAEIAPEHRRAPLFDQRDRLRDPTAAAAAARRARAILAEAP
jgi:diadenosine tetraphosphate (Ap4A) HIT family hydrolase